MMKIFELKHIIQDMPDDYDVNIFIETTLYTLHNHYEYNENSITLIIKVIDDET